MSITSRDHQRQPASAEDLADIAAYDRAKADLASGADELIPAEFANRLIAGESPVRVYREFRGLTQVALSEASGVNRVQIANIESGSKRGSVDTLKKLANVLGVSLGDLALSRANARMLPVAHLFHGGEWR